MLRWALGQTALLSALMPLTGVAFILFTNYMITDPGSTPFARRGQIIFGLTTAALYGLLVYNGVVFGLFFALVLTCLLRGAVLVSAPARAPGAGRAPGVGRWAGAAVRTAGAQAMTGEPVSRWWAWPAAIPTRRRRTPCGRRC